MAAVGAPLRDAGSELQNRGAVYLYRRNAGSGAWELLARLDAPDTGLDRLFGFSVALDGDYLAVGVRWGSTAEVNASGAVYVYRRTGPGSWSGPVRLTAAPPVANAWFGSAVSLSGDYLIVGAEQDGEAGASAGAAYIFRRTGTNAWDDQVKILAPDAVTAGDFGFAVSISGDVAVATAVYADAGTVPDGGAAYLLRRTGLNAWGDVSKFHAPDPETIGWFGHGAGISGTFVIIGASQEGPANEGAAYLFDVTP
jgi:hypothetical protein